MDHCHKSRQVEVLKWRELRDDLVGCVSSTVMWPIAHLYIVCPEEPIVIDLHHLTGCPNGWQCQ